MMDTYLRNRTAPVRDRLMQEYLAEAKTTSERFRGLVTLMDFGIACRKQQRENEANGK